MYLNGEVILQVDSVKYLGHHLTNYLHDDIDIRRQWRAINVRGNILFRKFHMCSVSVKLKLFNSYCASMYRVGWGIAPMGGAKRAPLKANIELCGSIWRSNDSLQHTKDLSTDEDVLI